MQGAKSILVTRLKPFFRTLLETEELRHQFAVEGRVAESELGGFCALEIKMHVMLPGKADSAMHLDSFPRDSPVTVRGGGLGGGGGQRRVGNFVADRPGRVVGD